MEDVVKNVKENENKNQKEGKQLLKPKNDVVFQGLFNQKNEKITKAFIEDLLEEKIEKIIINDTKELYREKPEDKLGILDLEAEINEEKKIDVEIQLIEKESFAERLLYYYAKLYGNEIKRGKTYDSYKKVVIIAILDFELEITKGIEKMEAKWRIREDENTKLILTDALEIHIIELSKIKIEYKKNKENRKVQWMMFLDNPNTEEVEEIMEENKEIREAVVEVHKMSKDEKIRKLAELREKAIMDEKEIYSTGYHKGEKSGYGKGKIDGEKLGYVKGEQSGYDKGQKNEKIKIAKILKEKGMSKEEISEITKLSIKEVEEI